MNIFPWQPFSLSVLDIGDAGHFSWDLVLILPGTNKLS